MSELILVEDTGGVRRLSLNRPTARNAQSRELLDALDEALDAAITNSNVRAIIIGGEGEHFSAGHDLKQAQKERANFTVEERWEYETRRYYDYCLKIWDCPKPTVAEVRGACVAGGFMVANMCDLILCSEDAFFSDPVGQTLAAAATEVLIHPWVMGLRRAKEMLFTGERLSAQEAHRIGMVNRVVPTEELRRETMQLAQRMADAPPFALRLMKRSLNRSLDMQGFRNSLNAHFDTHQLSHMSSEFAAVRDRGLAAAIQRNKAGESA